MLVVGSVTTKVKIKINEPVRIVNEGQIRNSDEKVGDIIGWRYIIEVPEFDITWSGDIIYDHEAVNNVIYEGPYMFETLVLMAHEEHLSAGMHCVS